MGSTTRIEPSVKEDDFCGTISLHFHADEQANQNRMYFSDATVDDLLRRVVDKLLSTKRRLTATRGDTIELTGVLLQLINPRARLSLTEKRGKLFSCLGELLWYLSGGNSVHFITHYVPRYRDDCEDGKTIHGGYGPRLFKWARNGAALEQINNVLKLLKKKPHSRRAVIQLFDGTDIAKDHKEIPCTCTLQFMIRGRRLHLFTSMRSNDAFLGLPHDIFAFTMLQEIMARSLGVELGRYKHFVASLHLYTKDLRDAQQYLDEGWQPKELAEMSPMPIGDPWLSVRKLLSIERQIRRGAAVNSSALNLDPYWTDLVRLLQIHHCAKKGHADEITPLKRAMSSRVYHPYIDRRHQRAAQRGKDRPEQLPLL
jgi:thymidylate synthase